MGKKYSPILCLTLTPPHLSFCVSCGFGVDLGQFLGVSVPMAAILSCKPEVHVAAGKYNNNCLSLFCLKMKRDKLRFPLGW